MPRFAANLSMMFNEVPFLDRFARARSCGFDGVEFLFPYEYPAADIAEALQSQRLTQALFNMPPGDWTKGERGMAALPGREEEFRDNLELALVYARALNCDRLHCMAGVIPADVDRGQAEAVYFANLTLAANRLAQEGRTLLIEPLNPRDAPGYFLSRQDDARDIVQGLGLPNLKVQFDMYHCQIVHGDLIRWTATMLPFTGHVQIADVPDRNEPGTGEINYTNVLARLDSLGYQGWVGCEYRPLGDTEEGLVWLRDLASSID
jgi:hydroxypyruvate isomerase